MPRFLILLACALPLAAQEINPADFRKQNDGTLIQDPGAPVSFRVPQGWELAKGQRWGDHETTLWLIDRGLQIVYTFYYQYPLNPRPKDDAETTLRQAIEAKVKQRQERDGMPDYRVREGSIRNQEVAGHPAMSYIGEFIQNGETRQEYMLRVLGEETKGHFFVMVRPANLALPGSGDLDEAIRSIETIAASLRMP
jgi:hypothetical protein